MVPGTQNKVLIQITYFSEDVKEQGTKIGDFEVVRSKIGAIVDDPCDLDDDESLVCSDPCELNEDLDLVCAEPCELGEDLDCVDDSSDEGLDCVDNPLEADDDPLILAILSRFFSRRDFCC